VPSTGAFGGAVASTGTVSMAGSTLASNSAPGGGAFLVLGGSLVSSNTELSGNTAASGGDGGGIYNLSGTVTLIRSSVTFNQPDNCAPPGSVHGCRG
jgi:hypothetical protein